MILEILLLVCIFLCVVQSFALLHTAKLLAGNNRPMDTRHLGNFIPTTSKPDGPKPPKGKGELI